jgi:hypothetical protein
MVAETARAASTLGHEMADIAGTIEDTMKLAKSPSERVAGVGLMLPTWLKAMSRYVMRHHGKQDSMTNFAPAYDEQHATYMNGLAHAPAIASEYCVYTPTTSSQFLEGRFAGLIGASNPTRT